MKTVLTAAKVGQGASAFFGSVAAALLVLELLLSSFVAPSELGLPDFRILLVIVAITAPVVAGLNRKFGISTPAFIGGGFGMALTIAAAVIGTIIVLFFIGTLAGCPVC